MPGTLNTLFQESAQRHNRLPALVHKARGEWRTITYGELAQRVECFARGLAALGVERGGRVSIVSENRPEWPIADFGLLALGAVNVPLFTSLSAPQVEHAVAHSKASVLVVSDAGQLRKALAVKERVPNLTVIVMDPPSEPSDQWLSFDQVLAMADDSPLDHDGYEAGLRAVEEGDLASIIYTSGATGEPKGVMLSHANFVANIRSAQAVLRFSPEDTLLSFLPLNHVFERLACCYLSLMQGARVAYCESIRRLRDNIGEIEPTLMILVPRVFEVFQDTMVHHVRKEGGRTAALFGWAHGVGLERIQCLTAGYRLPVALAAKWLLADRLILRRVREKLGLRRLRYFVSGGAPLPRATGEFFHALGTVLLEGYGLTETSPVVAVNRPWKYKLGTIGCPLKDVTVRIAEDGELLVRGPNVMMGYYDNEEATREAIDSDGWLHTGDLGHADADGYITITDRKKNILVLANGKNVAPQPIEGLLRGSEYIEQAVVLGERQTVVGALIAPAFARVREWAEAEGIDLPESASEMVAHPAVRRLFREEIEACTRDLADFEKVRRFEILDHDLTIEGGQLTPTMKLRRKVIYSRYADEIARMFG